MNQPEQGPGLFERMRNTATLLVLICQVLAVSSEVFLRGRFGSRYLGLHAALAAVAILFFGVFFPHDDPRPLFRFFLAYLFMCFLCRVGGIRLALKGHREHSRYDGRPLLSWILPRVPETTIKGMIEPALVLTAGVLLMPVSEPLGTYLLLSAIGLAGINSMIQMHSRRQAQEMYDAFLDQRQLTERFRQLRDDRHFR